RVRGRDRSDRVRRQVAVLLHRLGMGGAGVADGLHVHRFRWCHLLRPMRGHFGPCEPVTDATVFLRVNSHRAADRLDRLIGPLDWHYTMETGGCLIAVPRDRVTEALTVKSVTRARLHSEPRRCWR